MGDTVAHARVFGPLGSAETEVLVDTGATFSKVPASLAEKLGLAVQRQVAVQMADGRVIQRGLTTAEIEVEGVRRMVPLTLGAEGERPLLGYTALEILGFKVNPLTRRLEPTVALEYKHRLIGVGRIVKPHLFRPCKRPQDRGSGKGPFPLLP